MADVHINEYVSRKATFHDSPDTVYPKHNKTQPKIVVSGASQQSAAFDANTSFVSIRPVGGAVYIAFGVNPTATTNSIYLADGDVYDQDVDAGEKVAVITA